MKARHSGTALILLILAIGAGLYLLFGRPNVQTDSGESGQPELPASSDDKSTKLEEPARVQGYDDESPRVAKQLADAGKPRTKEDFLADFWGDRWPTVRARLREQNQDFSLQPEDPIPAWEEVGAEVCKRMRMSDAQRKQWLDGCLAARPMTEEYIRQKFGLEGLEIRSHNLIELDVLLEETSLRGMRAFANVEVAVNTELANKCARGDYYHGPYTTAADDRTTTEPAVLCSAYVVKGWAIRCFVFPSEIAHVEADLATLDNLKNEQRPIIATYLRKLRGG